MTKKIFVLLIASVMTLQGCSSGGSKDDTQVAESNDQQFAQEGEGDFAQGGDVPQDQIAQDGQQGAAVAEGEAPPQDMGQDLALDGQQQQAAKQLDVADGGAAKPQDELSLEDPQPLPEDIAANPADPAAAAPANPEPAPTDVAAAPTDEPLFKNGEAGAAAPGGEAMAATETAAAEPAAPKVYAPLLKVKEAAFNKNGTNLNRVYLGRAGDKWKSVSQKLYGKNRSKELKAWNSGIAGREVKVGDKVYYQSPNSPDDQKMLTYYEDMGLQPRTYVSKDGDDIKKVSKELLGGGESWKEVWATNQGVESKNKIPGGLEIRYWPEDLVAGAAAPAPANPNQQMAQNDPMHSPDMSAPPPPQDIPAPPPHDPTMAMNDVPPPPPPGGGIAPASTPDVPGGLNAGPTAPPPVDVPPPPPPPAPVEMKPKASKAAAAATAEGDSESMMAMGLGGLLLMAAAVIFVVLKKNRAKRVDLGQTQV